MCDVWGDVGEQMYDIWADVCSYEHEQKVAQIHLQEEALLNS